MAVLKQAGLDEDTEGLLAYHFWRWFQRNDSMVILSTRVLRIVPIRVRVKDLHFLFESLFGPEPFA